MFAWIWLNYSHRQFDGHPLLLQRKNLRRIWQQLRPRAEYKQLTFFYRQNYKGGIEASVKSFMRPVFGKETTMGDKSVETLGSKIRFFCVLETFPPFPPQQCWFFYFFDCTDHNAYTTLNWGAGGIRDLTLDANKIEQMFKNRKSSFPKSVSTTFVAHCLEAIYANCSDFLYISKL